MAEKVYEFREFEKLGITKRDLMDLVKGGYVELGYGKMQSNGQLLKLVKVTPKGEELMKRFDERKS